ncbi:Vacuolar iron transporter (VIT) family protein [Euphorbia peplus]|nr:Vacuolar iron transporter (VIT) family protein [Euphorbia peplus]
MEPKPSLEQTQNPISSTDLEKQSNPNLEIEVLDYSKRAQWLRAAVLGANDGLLSTTSLMVGVGAVRKDPKTMIITGIAGLLAGAFSMAIGEFVSVYSQYDTEMAQLKREMKSRNMQLGEIEAKKKEIPSPLQAAGASAFAFAIGAVIPLMGACFVKSYGVRVGVVIGLASLALLGFGWLGAVLGRTPVVKSSFRILVGGWLAMGITYGLTKAIGSVTGISL